MRRMTAVPSLLILAIMCAYWAYVAISTLFRDFSANVTVIDLMVLFILGFIAGIAVGLIVTRIIDNDDTGLDQAD
jgi:hypothetical protein